MANENREIKSSLFADLFADDELVGKKKFSFTLQCDSRNGFEA